MCNKGMYKVHEHEAIQKLAARIPERRSTPFPCDNENKIRAKKVDVRVRNPGRSFCVRRREMEGFSVQYSHEAKSWDSIHEGFEFSHIRPLRH